MPPLPSVLPTHSRPKIVTIVGARPQFIKSAPVSLAFQAAGIQEVLIHTGQHYDANMSDIFFSQLNLPQPDYLLQIGSGTHGYQTGEGLKQIEEILIKENPNAVLVYGDTNATLAGALAASKLHIPIAHIEAGLRSYNRRMPEEINRVLTDHLSEWLFVPTQIAIENLAQEGITRNVHPVGDVMLDAVQLFSQTAQTHCQNRLTGWQVQSKSFALLTLHRAETTDQPETVHKILRHLDSLAAAAGLHILFPVHPRIRPLVEQAAQTHQFQALQCFEPFSYFEMLFAEQHAKLIFTDSGGVQKEAAFFEVPCITLRTETEWVETVESGWNQLAALDLDKISQAFETVQKQQQHPQPIHHLYGGGEARLRIADILCHALTKQLALNT